MQQREFADATKLRILTQGDDGETSGWVQVITWDLKNERSRVHLSQADVWRCNVRGLNMAGGATAWNAGAQKLEKPRTLQGTQPYQHLDINQGDQLQPSGPPEL